jgi:flagellum-specific peptidoglycan hydrolase FlgJ
MANPLYFDPDPTIPDALELGYGDLILDDGTKRFLNGEPELAALVPPMPANDQSMGPPAPPQNYGAPAIGDTNPPPGVRVNMDGTIEPDSALPPGLVAPGQPPPTVGKVQPTVSRLGTAQAGDQRAGIVNPAQPGSDEPELMDVLKNKPGSPEAAQAASRAAGLPEGTVVDAHGNVSVNGQSAAHGYGTGGLVPAQREGALPPDVAARQSAELAAQQQNTLNATQQAQDRIGSIYQEATAKRLGELDAEKKAKEEALTEQTAKIERWRKEQKDTASTLIDDSLIGAQGIGAIFSVLGAALLGKVGSDAGLRMIQSSIDRYVRKQESERDSKLNVLKDQLGDAEQARSALREQLLKLTTEHAQAMQEKTKADVFEAQTPQIVQALQQQQLEERQKQEQLSLGKTIEKAPAAPKPPNWRAVEGYGKAERDQTVADEAVDRALAAIGKGSGVQPILDPKTGKITNKKEILDAGIPGVSKLQSMWQSGEGAFGGLMKNVNQMTVSEEGRQVQSALKTLVMATAKDQNGNRISDKDVPLAAQTMGMESESGTLDAIERLYKVRMERHEQNAAQFGVDAASEYQQTYRALGGKPPEQGASPAPMRRLEPGSAREQLKEYTTPKGSGNSAEDSLRQQGLMPDQQAPQAQRAATPQDRMAAVSDALQRHTSKELPPEGIKILLAQAAHETGDGKSAPQQNFFGMKGKGASLETTEGSGADAKKVRQGFKAYSSPDESVSDMIDLLKRRYPDAWTALESGDVDAYAAALKDGGFYTDSETNYVNGLKRRL